MYDYYVVRIAYCVLRGEENPGCLALKSFIERRAGEFERADRHGVLAERG